ncbi:ubiquinone biosynthesis protein COQ3, mitochondrial isoform X2 [Leptinotarsa decemlineata]|uniref:ubiquinone biosynthesis protein COQ3, mitochondrial isoform X2 n=1 Tax=Leptinotarsa decemlineata TaxID=7539 RepID=UPI000C255695|nr:2-methoxy-6-polyprenyl-1,4-benzoquinol methylase, mitochondrial isoform X2 [Leptinotarsa decemlineata]
MANVPLHKWGKAVSVEYDYDTPRQTIHHIHVHKVFENVAMDYDVMNDAMSLGIHRIWKDYFMCKLHPTNNTKLLDVAGGTGDIAFRFLNSVKNNQLKDCHVTVCDINANMLEVGKIRSVNLKHSPNNITWKEGNAEMLPFHDKAFNAYTIAFGIRNCTHIDKVLEEAYRVLQPGGRFMCLEFSHLENSTAQWIYDQYSFQMIPVLGQVIAGQWKPYQYLVESIRQFPHQDDFKLMIEEAGFRQVTYENLTLGVVAIHSGFKL